MSSLPVVAMCSVGELFGGVERHLLGMCEWFARRGTTPLLILFHDRELAAQARALGFSPVILESSGSFDLSVPRRLADILQRKNVNLVHAHGYRAMVNTALARRYHDFAVVRTVHGLVEPSRLFSLQWIKSHLYNWLEKTASSRSEATVCYVTEDLRQRRKSSDGGRKTLTVYNGIDPVDRTRYSRPSDLAEGAFNFAAVGRVSAVKGLETILLAMKDLDPASGAVLNIIGTGPATAELQALASDLQLGQRVRFLGFKKNVYDYLTHVDALVMPSRHEGLPYTILETMSLGTAIIASRVGGLAEVLVHGETALLVEAGDAAGWTEAMADLLADSSKVDGLGAAGFKKQTQSFTLDSMGASYWQVYLEKLEQHLSNA